MASTKRIELQNGTVVSGDREKRASKTNQDAIAWHGRDGDYLVTFTNGSPFHVDKFVVPKGKDTFSGPIRADVAAPATFTYEAALLSAMTMTAAAETTTLASETSNVITGDDSNQRNAGAPVIIIEP